MLDNPYKVIFDRVDTHKYISTIELKDGSVLLLILNRLQYAGATTWDFYFTRDDEYIPTGTRDEIKIFSTVVNALLLFVKHMQPPEISFQARNYDKFGPSDRGSKEKLYDRLLKKYCKTAGYTYHTKTDITGTKFYITRDYNEKI